MFGPILFGAVDGRDPKVTPDADMVLTAHVEGVSNMRYHIALRRHPAG